MTFRTNRSLTLDRVSRRSILAADAGGGFTAAATCASSTAVRRFGVAALWAGLVCASASWNAVADDVLEVHNASLTTYLPTSPTNVQNISPIVLQRGVHLDGTLRHGPTWPMALAGNPSGESWNSRLMMSGLRLDTGTYSQVHVDLSLPTDGHAVVIARTYNARQVDDSSHHDSNGYQGRNWFQMAQPEIILYDADSDPETLEVEDVLYLVYGADRFIEFRRIDDASEEFRATNGAAGGMKRTAAAGGEPETYTFTDQVGNQFVFFGFDIDAAPAEGQFWKAITPKHPSGEWVTFVGDASTASTAIANGYTASGQIEYLYDASDRRFTFDYTTYDSVDRLTQVKAETKSGGTWASPTGVVEVGKVDYDYYRSTGNTTYGDNGCLERATVTLPLTDSGLSSVTNTYYRYWKGTFNDTTNPGHPYALQYIVDREGTRRFDWADEDMTDADYETASEGILKPYAAAYFEYDSSHRVDKGWFNGECGCSGAANGEHAFEYEVNGSYTDTSGYTDAWTRRTTINRPDSGWEVFYFDEAGQPLHWILADGDPDNTGPAPNFWVTEVDRNSAGQLIEIRTPAANASYTHSTATFSANASAGLITVFTRVSSGNLTGLLETIKHKKGTSGTAFYDQKLTYTSQDKAISGSVPTVTITRPAVSGRTIYESETSSDTGGLTTSVTYTWYTGELIPKMVLTTSPAVTTAKNGSNTATTSAVYLRRDGTVAFSEAQDGIFAYTAYTKRQVTTRVEDVITNGSFPSGDDPNTDWSITETGNGSNRTTTMTYDAQGRLDVTTLPDGRLTKQYYTKLQSERLITLSIPRYTTATPTYYGPVGYSVSNHAGRGEFSGSIALSGGSTTSALSTWIDEADATFKDDPIKAVDVGTVTRMATSVYDESGTKLEESRSYFDLPASGAGTVGTHYDATAYTYDVMGRTETVTDPTGTIRLTVFDTIGRVSSHTIGTVNGGGGDNMVTTDLVVYDAGGVGNSFVTTRTARVQSGTTDQRTTTYEYDVRGRLMVVKNATAPHVLNKYDNLGRLVATGLYSSDSGLDETDDPTSLTTNRVALSATDYDERGMVWRTRRYRIASNGTNPSGHTLDTLTWYDAPGRVIKTVGGQVTKTFYDRLGRQTHQFILAKAFDSGGSGETLYADADDVAYDIVMEEHRTTYESTDSDNVIMSAVIARHHDDKDTGETLGALDTNADTDDLLYTAANLEGRIQITATWFDDLDRVTTTAFYGTNGGSNFDRDGLSVPTRSDTILVTSYVYNDDGTLLSVTDPEALVTRFVYDDLGRQVTVINNYINGTPSSETGDDDLFTRYVFEDGLQRKMWVDIDGDGTEDAEDQVTTYTYGVTTGQTPASTITVNHLLREVKYPDSGGASDVVVYAYNAQGQTLAMKDQAGNVHEYIFDLSGRQTIDKATTIATGAGFDDDVQRIETAYDTLGRVSTITQYDATSSGTVLDQVKHTYGDWGTLEGYRQDRNGLVDAGGSVDDYAVSYTYVRNADAGERQTVRLVNTTLPSGKIVTMVYSPNNGRHDQELSRVTIVREELGANDVNLVRYEYLGVGHVVGTEYLESSVYSRVYSGSPATYGQLDRFNRITSSSWVKDLSTDRTFYQVDLTYDRNSNITWAEDQVHTGFDVKYTLDDLNRLVMAEEGTESSGSIASRTRQELWTLTQTGNWELFKRDINGNNTFSDSGDFNDDRTHNVVNELTARDIDDNGTDDYTLTYDATGNLTGDGEAYTYVYDAWYRLRKVKNAITSALIAELTYYGNNHRKGHHYDVDGDGTVEDTSDDPWAYFAWNERWQLLATFEGSTSTPAEEWVLHQAGLDGRGGSSYIDDVILRDRDTDGNGSLDERLYLCQNWRHDLSAIVTDTGKMVEWVKYSSYGEPLALPGGDTDSDGDWDATDSAAITGGYDVRKDAELDGDVDASDITQANSIVGGYQTLGRTVLSSTAVNNRKGYAGYERDHSIGELHHVRHRVLHTTLGRWTRRDPLRYLDGTSLYVYVRSMALLSVDPTGLVMDGGGLDGGNECGSEVIAKCSKEHPELFQRALEHIKANCPGKNGRCPTWKVYCEEWGPTQEIKDGIKNLPRGRLCANACRISVTSGADGGRSCVALIHEMIHAGDYCAHGQWSNPTATPKQVQDDLDSGGKCGQLAVPAGGYDYPAVVCNEIRTYYYTCCTQPDFDPGFLPIPKGGGFPGEKWPLIPTEEDTKDCLRRFFDTYWPGSLKNGWDDSLIEKCVPHGGKCDKLREDPVPPFPYRSPPNSGNNGSATNGAT